MEKEERANNSNTDMQVQPESLLGESETEEVQGQSGNFQSMNPDTQVILVEENEQTNSFNWRLTKKNIGSFLVIVLSMLFFFFIF